MPADYPYMRSQKNLPKILSKIKIAQTPPRFTHEFLKSNLGFRSSNDRTAIKVLKQLGLLSSDSRPTSRYNEFRADPDKSPALAEGLREGWSEVFLSDQHAYERSATELKEILKNVTGKSDSVSTKLASTFKTLAAFADFSAARKHSSNLPSAADENETEEVAAMPSPAHDQPVRAETRPSGALALHNDVHIHLPATSDTAVYTAIFRALREELL